VKVSCSLLLISSLNFSATVAVEKRRSGVSCPNEDRRFEEDCLVSLTVFDHGDIVTLSSHCFSSPAEIQIISVAGFAVAFTWNGG
jgi:hypothetical protein